MHIGQFVQQDVSKKYCQSSIFYLVPSLTFMDDLVVDSHRSKFYVADPIIPHRSGTS